MRAIILVMDSVGIGVRSRRVRLRRRGRRHRGTYRAGVRPRRGRQRCTQGPLDLPNLISLGLAEACRLATGQAPPFLAVQQAGRPFRLRGRNFQRQGHAVRDTGNLPECPSHSTGAISRARSPCFPDEIVAALCRRARLPGILGNCHASGTEIITRLGEAHVRSGMPICYTSADSVFQIAAHEQEFGLARLYEVCEIARELLVPLNIGRVIARPFRGSPLQLCPDSQPSRLCRASAGQDDSGPCCRSRSRRRHHRQDRRHFRAPGDGPGLERRRQRRAVRSHVGRPRYAWGWRIIVCQFHRLRLRSMVIAAMSRVTPQRLKHLTDASSSFLAA